MQNGHFPDGFYKWTPKQKDNRYSIRAASGNAKGTVRAYTPRPFSVSCGYRVQTMTRRTREAKGKNRRKRSCVCVLCSHNNICKFHNPAAVLDINRTNTRTYKNTKTNILRLNVKIMYFSRYAEKRTNPAGAPTERKHVALRACVCVLCSHDAVCCAPAGFERKRNEERHSRKESIILLLISGMAPQRLRPTIRIICPCPKGQEQIIIPARSAVMRARGLCRPRKGQERKGGDSPKFQNHSAAMNTAIIKETTESATRKRPII